jgi:hypothetical protein
VGAVVTFAAGVLPAQQAKGSKAAKTVWPDEGPRTWAPRPTVADITANDLRTRLYQIADDSMQGRRIGEPGNAKVTAYIAAEFKRLGLKPAGDSGTYFQELPFGASSYDAATSKLGAGAGAFTPGTDWVPVTGNVFAGTGNDASFANVPTVFAGRWGDTTVVLDPAVFRGKVAVFVAGPNAPGFTVARPAAVLRCDSVPDKFGTAAVLKWEAEQAAKPKTPVVAPMRDRRAVQAGAVAVLIVGLDTLPAIARTAPFTPRNMMQPNPSTVAPGAAAISQTAATTIFGKSLDGLAIGATGQAVSASWTYAWKKSAAPARNVVAIMPGSDPTRAAEYVVVGAHNDHVGTSPTAVDHDSLRAVNTVTRRQGNNDPICRPTEDQQRRIDSLIRFARSVRPARRDSIFNGADDDGSGTVVMLEIAERFANEKPARSIVFVSHQGEEAGLLGSRWFVDHPTIALDKVVAVHNMDMLGKGRADQVKFGGPNSVQTLGSRRLSREFGDIIDSVNAVRSEPMAIDRSWDVRENPLNRFCRSDQVNYVRKDIPTTYFSLGYAQDYHQVTDEPQYIEYDHAARLARFIHDVMSAISERKDRPAIAGPDPTYPRC